MRSSGCSCARHFSERRVFLPGLPFLTFSSLFLHRLLFSGMTFEFGSCEEHALGVARFILETCPEGTMARKYGEKAQATVEEAMHKYKHGGLKSGKSGKKVTNPKQAIAIGLAEARHKGAKVPPASKS